MNIRKLSRKPVIALALLPFAAMATIQDELVLPGITGTDTVGGFNNLITVRDFSTSGAANTLSVERLIDATSPALFRAALLSDQFASATLYQFDSEPGAAPHLTETYAFSNVTLKSYGTSSTVGTPLESLQFGYKGLSVSTPTVKAPELDASSAASGLTLLVGCVLVLGARRLKPNAMEAA